MMINELQYITKATFITSAKEVLFSVELVHFSVCLLAYITEKVMNRF